MKFYDRKEELALLQNCMRQAQETATFCVLTGRRRVGKTVLITKAIEKHDHAYLFVSKDSEAYLCRKFQKVLQEQLGLDIYGTPAKFGELFEIIMKESTRRHFTVVFDEFQTLYQINPAIFGEIQDIWDRYHRDSKLCLIASGSVRTLMKRIFEDKGEPLYGRPTSKLTLLPFKISVLKEIMADYAPEYSSEDLLCLYMLTGGVAKYVELLMDAKSCSKDAMLDYVCRPDSYFLSEGRDLINQEFTGDSSTYYSILQLIAAGRTRRSEIDGSLEKDTGAYLQNLERNFRMIVREKPLLAKPGSKTSAYAIKDNFLRFWFRFICPYQALVEQQQLAGVRANIDRHYDTFSGKTLERYFRQKYMETGEYTLIGNWWDNSGVNEIDMIALNEFDHTGVVAEIKRNPKRISLNELTAKALHLPAQTFAKYRLTPIALSMDDM